MNSLSNYLQFPAGTDLLSRWQAGGKSAQVKLRALFDAAMKGEFDAIFCEPAPTDSVSVTASLHMLILTILNQLYGLTSADFYKDDPQRYVRTTLITQRLLGIRKLTLHWPAYAFGAEALGQAMLYPEKHVPGVDAGKPLLNRKTWQELGTPNFRGIIPQIIEEMLVCFSDLTSREPVAHIPAPYSLAADIFGQEALLFALMDEPDFVNDLLAHLTEQVFVPWCTHLSQCIPNIWIELSDASGSPVFIGPDLFRKFAAPPVHHLIRDFPWGERVFVANYRGDMPMGHIGGNEQGKVETESNNAKSATDALVELINYKLSLCPGFIIKLDADKAHFSIYVEQAIQLRKPLTLGIGATRIDRNSIVDRDKTKQEIKKLATDYALAIKTVSEALTIDGCPNLDLPSPCGIYIEDINAESDLEMVKTIIEMAAIHGKKFP